jgi:S-disulfanyl-L-cysteine oxidoreductase SoxD
VFAKKYFRPTLLGIMAALSYQPVHGQAADGLYTADQAHRGEAAYQKQCLSCHGAALDGVGPYPTLSGDDFLSKYQGQPLLNVYDMIQKLMPADHPGSLTRPQASDLLAYILSFDKFPAGKTELPNDEETLKKVQLPKPAPAS